jgi:hypothetical protein
MADELHEKLAEARERQSLILHRLGEVEVKLREHAEELKHCVAQHQQAALWRERIEPEIATVRDAKKGILDRAGNSILLVTGGAGLAALLAEALKALKGGP